MQEEEILLGKPPKTPFSEAATGGVLYKKSILKNFDKPQLFPRNNVIYPKNRKL